MATEVLGITGNGTEEKKHSSRRDGGDRGPFPEASTKMALTHPRSELYLMLPSAVMEPNRVRTAHPRDGVFLIAKAAAESWGGAQPHSKIATEITLG